LGGRIEKCLERIKNKVDSSHISALNMVNQSDKPGSEMSSTTRSAIWEHYYMKDDELRTAPIKKRLRRITKKEIIVRTLKDQKSREGIMSLQELSAMTGLSPHDLSGHLTHLVNEGKVVRRGRGLFALSLPVPLGKSHKDELKNLVKSYARRSSQERLMEEKLVITDADHSESRRMMLDFLSDALLKCSDVELVISCKKDDKGKGGQTTIELKAH